MSVLLLPILASDGIRYGSGPVGEPQEVAETVGTIFDGTDTYPNDINTAAAGTKFLLRASGSPYGTNASELKQPDGVTVKPYNGESVILNGVVEVANDDIVLAGVQVHLSGTQDDSVVGMKKTSGSTSVYIERPTIRNCHLRNNGGRHGVSLVGNVRGAKLLNLKIERYGGNAFGGANHEIFLQEDSPTHDFWPVDTFISNIEIISDAAGTDDGIQLQEVGETWVEYVSLSGTHDENWIDLKTRIVRAETGPYTFYRCVVPARVSGGGNSFLTRADVNILECIFDGAGAQQSTLVVGNPGDAKSGSPIAVNLQRCHWINQSAGDELILVQKSQGSSGTPSVNVIGCSADGGKFVLNSGGGWTQFRLNNFDGVTLEDNGSDGVVCDNNRIVGGGWGVCTGAQ